MTREMIELYDNETGDLVGEITDRHLRFLISELEETSTSDRDYYLDASVLDSLEEAGADEQLLEVLQNALGNKEDAEIRWEKSGVEEI